MNNSVAIFTSFLSQLGTAQLPCAAGMGYENPLSAGVGDFERPAAADKMRLALFSC
jgi:hypothetical protein